MIEFKDMTFKFGDKAIFEGFNYVFEEGKVYCMMGPSGCGKSTLLKLMCGLLKPTQGKVLYNGEEPRRSDRNIFMMHQTYTNFPWKNCIQNVLFPIQLHEKVTPQHVDEAQKMLAIVGLGDCITMFPHELSGGMKQRLALARVLVSKPKVILMDEPLGALDPAMRLKMQDLILQTHKEINNTIIMVTHDDNEGKRMSDTLVRLGKD